MPGLGLWAEHAELSLYVSTEMLWWGKWGAAQDAKWKRIWDYRVARPKGGVETSDPKATRLPRNP